MIPYRPMPRHAAIYFESQGSNPAQPSLLSRVLFWHKRTAPTRSAGVRRLIFPLVFATLFALFLVEEFWLWIDRSDWRSVDRQLTFAGQWFLGLVFLYLVFEVLLAFNSGALDFLVAH